MENLRVLEGSEVFFRGLQHLYPRFKSGWHLCKASDNGNYLRYFFGKNLDFQTISNCATIESKNLAVPEVHTKEVEEEDNSCLIF